MSSDYNDLGEHGRDRDRAGRRECDLPPTRPEAPRQTGPSPADLDAAFGIGQRPTSAAEERRVRDTWRR
jgi:hypothetical protein